MLLKVMQVLIMLKSTLHWSWILILIYQNKLQVKLYNYTNTVYTIKNKFKKISTGLGGTKFETTLILVLKKIENEEKTK